MKTLIRKLIPLIIFLVVVAFLWQALGRDPSVVTSPLIDQPVPPFSLPNIDDPDDPWTEQDLKGQISLMNVWATWCQPCIEELPVLMHITQTTDIPIYGLDYKDEHSQAEIWLKQLGNPFVKTGFDGAGRVAIDWGVYGVPETFIIDQEGIVRYKHIGILTEAVWQDTLLPIIESLQRT